MLDFLKTLWNPIATPAGVVIGAVVLQLWRRYLSRMVTVRWSVTHENIALGGHNPDFGNVEILYNGNPAGNRLQACRVEVENESGSQDLSALEVRLEYDANHAIFLSGGGFVDGDNDWLQWAPNFQAQVNQYLATQPPPAGDHLFRRRDYLIPVFNRGAKAIFVFLVRSDVPLPNLRVYCQHLTVRLRHQPQRPMLLGVVQSHAGIVGAIAGLLLAAILSATPMMHRWVPIFIALAVGWYGAFLGVGVIRAWRWLVRMVG